MKKILTLLLLAAIVLSLAACAAETAPVETEQETLPQTDTVETPAAPEKTEEPEQPKEPEAPEETEEPEAPEETEEPSQQEEPQTPEQSAEPEQTEQTEQPEQTAPTEQTEQPAASAETGVSLADVRTAIINGLGIEGPLMLETDALLGLYGIEASIVAQSASFVTMSGTFPDEIILVEAVDEAAAASIAASLQNRLNEVLVQSQTYDADNYAAAQACTVRTNGLFVALILSPKQAEIAGIYENYVG